MKQNELKPAPGANRARKRVGRGNGSGHGTYATRGLKGQKSRSGVTVRPGFEGGQTPIIKKLPNKRGFNNKFAVPFAIVNLKELTVFSPDSKVGPKELAKMGLIKSEEQKVKILGNGDLDRALVVTANRFSGSAERKIVAAGGSVEKI